MLHSNKLLKRSYDSVREYNASIDAHVEELLKCKLVEGTVPTIMQMRQVQSKSEQIGAYKVVKGVWTGMYDAVTHYNEVALDDMKRKVNDEG